MIICIQSKSNITNIDIKQNPDLRMPKDKKTIIWQPVNIILLHIINIVKFILNASDHII